MYSMTRLIVCLTIGTSLVASYGGHARAETGIASYYSDLKVTASGRSYRPSDSVAAHRKLPFGTHVRVTNLANGRSAIVRIVDRGPFIRGRVIDVTPSVANTLGFHGRGLTRVTLAVVGKDNAGAPKPITTGSIAKAATPKPAKWETTVSKATASADDGGDEAPASPSKPSPRADDDRRTVIVPAE
jgi:rare lipoprotein A